MGEFLEFVPINRIQINGLHHDALVGHCECGAKHEAEDLFSALLKEEREISKTFAVAARGYTAQIRKLEARNARLQKVAEAARAFEEVSRWDSDPEQERHILQDALVALDAEKEDGKS